MKNKLIRLLPSKVNNSFHKAELFVGYNADNTLIQLTYTLDIKTFLNVTRDRPLHTTQLRRRDELWTSNCLEYFVKLPNSPAYLEFNFSLSGDWNVFLFSNYREGKREFKDIRMKKFDKRTYKDTVEFSIVLESKLSQKLCKGHGSAILLNGEDFNYFNSLIETTSLPDFHRFT